MAIFVSAALLFAVQPIFTKMVLPKLGGSAAVWSVAMVFFQAVLLAGYAYAHLLTRYVPTRYAVILHGAVMLAAILALPLGIAEGWDRPPTENESLWLLGLFTVSIGLPFFALSANAPLLQAWFARGDHPRAHDPYFLYAASNVGSIIALLSYPFVVEPFSRLGPQTRAWSIAFYGLIVLIGACGAAVVARQLRRPRALQAAREADARPTWSDAAIWMALAAVPSALLIAVTAHLSTDVAPSPFLWVIPLALYLLTFVIVFAQNAAPARTISRSWSQPILLVGLVATIVYTVHDYLPLVMLLHVVTFFVTALVCHGELARRRPAAGHLTVVLHVDVRRRRDRRHLRRIARAAVVLVDRRISDRHRAGDPVPAGSAQRQPAAESAGRSHCSSIAAAIVVVPATFYYYGLDDKTFYWSLGALLVLALAASQIAKPARLRGAHRAHVHGLALLRGRTRPRPQLLRRAQGRRPRRRRAGAAARHDHSWRRTPERRRGRARRPARCR